jgi:hypothetical protein
MTREQAIALLSQLTRDTLGVFGGHAAVALGVTRKQLHLLCRAELIERMHPDTYRLVAVAPSHLQSLRAALLWAGSGAVAAGRSAGEVYGLEGVGAIVPEVAVPRRVRRRSPHVTTFRTDDRRSLMIRHHRGVPVTGVEATLLALARQLNAAQLEVACEDARRRRLTSIPALRAYLDRFGGRGRSGAAKLRALLDELDPANPSRSTLEVMTRRLLVAHGLTGFVREYPITDGGRTYRYDFAFLRERVILETNGRRWHDDPSDYEADHEKWSVPGRYGFRIVFATWAGVTPNGEQLVRELRASLSPRPPSLRSGRPCGSRSR